MKAGPMCGLCKHFARREYPFRCAAYPDGIPDAIVENRVDHRKPYAGDHGIRFELAEDVASPETAMERIDFLLRAGRGGYPRGLV